MTGSSPTCLLVVVASAAISACGARQLPAEVETNPTGGESVFPIAGLRYRTYADDAGGEVRWSGVPIPGFIPVRSGGANLSILDLVPNGYFAFYRPIESEADSGGQSPLLARVYDGTVGTTLFEVDLRLHIKDSSLEVQDARYDNGVIYFNEVCAQWSDATSAMQKPCGELVAIDSRNGARLWTSTSYVSSGQFLLNGRYALSVFTATERFLGSSDVTDVYLLDRTKGEVVASDDAVIEDRFFGFDESEQTVRVIFDHQSVVYSRGEMLRGKLTRVAIADSSTKEPDEERKEFLRGLEEAGRAH